MIYVSLPPARSHGRTSPCLVGILVSWLPAPAGQQKVWNREKEMITELPATSYGLSKLLTPGGVCPKEKAFLRKSHCSSK